MGMRIYELRVGDRVVPWVGIARARRWCQIRELAAWVVPARPAAQAGPALASSGNLWDSLVLLARATGPLLPLTSAVGLARQVRRALMACAAASSGAVAEVISGHRPDGAPADRPHLAVVPLPELAGAPAGTLAGVALVLPRALDPAARAAVAQALARAEAQGAVGAGGPAVRIALGATGELVLQRVDAIAHRGFGPALQPATWIGPSRRWATATPIALDRHPGELRRAGADRQRRALAAAAASLCEAARRAGLPAPQELEVLLEPPLPGAPPLRAFPRFPAAAGRAQRVLVYARIGFAAPVRGPILLGAGRYQGLGLMSPEDGA